MGEVHAELERQDAADEQVWTETIAAIRTFAEVHGTPALLRLIARAIEQATDLPV